MTLATVHSAYIATFATVQGTYIAVLATIYGAYIAALAENLFATLVKHEIPSGTACFPCCYGKDDFETKCI